MQHTPNQHCTNIQGPNMNEDRPDVTVSRSTSGNGNSNANNKSDSKCINKITGGSQAAEKEVMKHNLFHIKLPFPWKLHQLLEDVETENNEDIISWNPDGKSFKVHKENEFCSQIMSKYFRLTKFKSFTRQLYMYGFSKLEGGLCNATFAHPQFMKGERSLCLSIERNKSEDRRSKKAKTTKKADRSKAKQSGAQSLPLPFSFGVVDIYNRQTKNENEIKVLPDPLVGSSQALTVMPPKINTLSDPYMVSNLGMQLSMENAAVMADAPLFRGNNEASGLYNDWLSALESNYSGLARQNTLNYGVPDGFSQLDFEPRSIEAMVASSNGMQSF